MHPEQKLNSLFQSYQKHMIKAIIIDDEEHSRTALSLMLKEHFPELDIVGMAHNVKSGIECIQKHSPHLVFLDIQMPDGTGFDLLNRLEIFNFEIIFTTAYNEYAFDAFQLPALGYLLKPISDDQLKITVHRAMSFIKDHEQDVKPSQFKEQESSRLNKILLSDSDGFEVVPLNQIIRMEGDRNYTRIFFTEKQPVLSSHNLGWFEKLLTQNGEFFRASKSHLINLHHVSRYSKADGGWVFMSDHSQVHLSEGRKDKLKEFFLKSG
jgi:two-component system, LytTR family, response regulator